MPDYILLPLCVVMMLMIFFVTLVVALKSESTLWTAVAFLLTLFFCISVNVYANQVHPEWFFSKNHWLATYDVILGLFVGIGCFFCFLTFED